MAVMVMFCGRPCCGRHCLPCGRHGHGLWPSWFVAVMVVAVMVMVCGRHGIGAIRHLICFVCYYFQESTEDSFSYPVILFNIISSVACCTAPFMDMLRRFINCRTLLLGLFIIIIKDQGRLGLNE